MLQALRLRLGGAGVYHRHQSLAVLSHQGQSRLTGQKDTCPDSTSQVMPDLTYDRSGARAETGFVG